MSAYDNLIVQLSNMRQLLTTATTMYQQYTAVQRNQGSDLQYLTELSEKEMALQKELDVAKHTAETYDREFQDRRRNPRPLGLFERAGLKTTQDWALFLLYVSIGSLFLAAIVVVLVSETEQKGVMIGAILATAVIVGLGVTSVLLRFA